MKEKLTFDNLTEKGGILLFRYYRGSTAQNLRTETSDYDEGGVYMCSVEQLLGLGLDYQEEIADEKHDKVWYELNKFMELLLKSNPTVLEALFVDDEYVLYEHDIMKQIRAQRNLFLTQETFKPLYGYGASQIQKATGYNKKCTWDEEDMKRKYAIDYCFTTHKQGTTNISNWLAYRGLYQEFCGLVKLPHIPNGYSLFYDFGSHCEREGYTLDEAFRYYYELVMGDTGITTEDVRDDYKFCLGRFIDFEEVGTIKPVTTHYRGLFKNLDSTELRLSSIDDKTDVPLCILFFNENGFKQHCKRYKEYQVWKKERNVNRFNLNKGYNFDAKNMSHSFRLVNMGVEIAKGEGFNVKRTVDRDFLLDIKHHKYDYETLMEMLEKKHAEMNKAMEVSTIPESIDRNAVNDLLLAIRKKQIYEAL